MITNNIFYLIYKANHVFQLNLKDKYSKIVV